MNVAEVSRQADSNGTDNSNRFNGGLSVVGHHGGKPVHLHESMHDRLYILTDENKPIKVHAYAWSLWMQLNQKRTIVRLSTLGSSVSNQIMIRTSFSGIDLRTDEEILLNESPVLFETEIDGIEGFGKPRYISIEAAILHHLQIRKLVKTCLNHGIKAIDNTWV